jgi:hypothetical protein
VTAVRPAAIFAAAAVGRVLNRCEEAKALEDFFSFVDDVFDIVHRRASIVARAQTGLARLQ